jgi:hypothetical protein
MAEVTDADRINLLGQTPFAQVAKAKVARATNAAPVGAAASAPVGADQSKFLKKFSPEERLAQQRALAQALRQRQ